MLRPRGGPPSWFRRRDSGDPNFDRDHKPEYNEGVPIAAILDLLAARGKRSQIAAAPPQ